MIFDLVLLALVLGVRWWTSRDLSDLRNQLSDVNARLIAMEYGERARVQRLERDK